MLPAAVLTLKQPNHEPRGVPFQVNDCRSFVSREKCRTSETICLKVRTTCHAQKSSKGMVASCGKNAHISHMTICSFAVRQMIVV